MKPLVITLHKTEENIIINEDQVCSIEPYSKAVRIKMSNGDEYIATYPTFEQWENDLLIQD